MSRFLWTGIDEQGIQETGAIEGSSAASVVAKLNQQGKFRVALRRLSDYAVQQNLGEETLRSVLSFLGRLLRSGIGLHLSLNEAISHFKAPTLKYHLCVVRDQLLEGESLGNALASTRAVPDMVTRTLVAAESSDRLAESIDELYELLQLRRNFLRDQRRLLLYPMTVLGVFLLLVLGMLVYVIPMFGRLYTVAGDQLFWPTQVMVGLSELLRGSREGWLAAVLLLGLGGLGIRRYGKLGSIWAKVPGVRELRRKIQAMMYARAMSSGLHSGLPLTMCLQLMEPMLMDFQQPELSKLRERVEHGEGLGESYQRVSGLGPRFANAVSAGEATGDLAGAFAHVSDDCRIEVEHTLGRFNAYLEPVLMILIASGVLVFLLSIYLPLFQVAEYY
ncbi:MAG TPA: hypothetical protein EYM25_07070 [Deltaproteobacteria bacterium]|nr:hypothetical protein [Deltaproteobacteria bacterium]